MTPNHQNNPAPRPKPAKKPLTARRFRRKVWRGFLILVVTLLVALLIVTRTGVTKQIVLGPIRAATGLALDAGSVVIASDLSIIMHDATLTAPDLPDKAARVFAVDRLVIRLDWLALPSPDAITEIQLESPRLRISQDRVNGSLNLAALPLFGGGGSSGMPSLPTVVVRSGMVELGEHAPEAPSASDADPDQGSAAEPYTVLAEIPFSGVLAPQRNASGASEFSLTRGMGETGLEITGVIDQTGATVLLGGLVLSDWPIEAIPTRVRDLWERLDIEGRIVPARIGFSATGDLRIEGSLDGVELTLPFLSARDDAGDGSNPIGPPPRLTSVNGTFVVTENSISADLTGDVGTLRQRVVFDHWGFDLRESPFTARLTTDPMRLERDLALLDYVPDVVNKNLDLFGRPEADLEATIWLARKQPPDPARVHLTGSFSVPAELAYNPDASVPDDTRIFGRLRIRNGNAAYRGFPYRFHQMSGEFSFTRKTLWIDKLRGVAPSGAVLNGNGRIGPLGPTSEVILGFVVGGIPIDDDLTAAMSEQRRSLVDALFSEPDLAELQEAGLVRTPEDARGITDRLASIAAERDAWSTGGIAGAELERLDAEQSRLEADLAERPVFNLGGNADVRITVHRQEGLVSIWTRHIEVTMPEVGLLSEHFPVPIIARDAGLVITDGNTDFSVTEGSTLNGGDVDLTASITLGEGAPKVPEITIDAADVPINEILIRAIAGPDNEMKGEGPIRLATLLRTLNPEGLIDSAAQIFPRGPDGDRLGYDISSRIHHASARLDDRSILIDGVEGTVGVNPSRVDLDLTGTLRGGGPDAGTGLVPGASIRATMSLPEGASWTDSGDKPPPSIDATFGLPLADVRLPLENVVAVFDAGSADLLTGLRERYDPGGRLTIETDLRGTLGPEFVDEADVAVAITDIDRVALTLDGIRIEGTDAEGTAVVRPGAFATIDFNGFEAALTADGVPSGRIGFDDEIPLGADAPPSPWGVTVEGGRFESPLTDWALRKGSSGFADWAAGYSPRGAFDLTARRRVDEGFEGELRPRSLTLASDRGDAVFDEASGAVRFAPEGGEIASVVARGDAHRIVADGQWAPLPDRTAVRLTLGVEADRLDPPLVGLLPPVVSELFASLEADAAGGVSAPAIELSFDAGTPTGVGRVTASGAVRVENASLSVGAPVTELDGTVVFDISRPDGVTPSTFSVSVDAQRWRLLGLRMTGGRAEILSGLEPGSVLVPEISATAHGGRFTGAVRLAPRPDGGRDYWTELQLAEIRLAPMLEDVRVADRSLADEVRDDVAAYLGDTDLDDTAWDQSADRSRGLVNASFSLTGVVGSNTGRRGRGRVIASGGPVLQLPLITPMLEISNLRLPVGDELGLALASVYLEDDRLVFEDLAVFSDQIELLGFGDMVWPDGEIDLRFRSRALARIPVVSGVLESVRDEILGTRLTGTLAEPKVTTESFAATRRVVGSLLWGGGPDGERQLRAISAGSAEARARIRRAGEILDRAGSGQVAPTRRGRNDAP